jgi:hypothetical protein
MFSVPVTIRRAIFWNVCRAPNGPLGRRAKAYGLHRVWQTSSCNLQSRQLLLADDFAVL